MQLLQLSNTRSFDGQAFAMIPARVIEVDLLNLGGEVQHRLAPRDHVGFRDLHLDLLEECHELSELVLGRVVLVCVLAPTLEEPGYVVHFEHTMLAVFGCKEEADAQLVVDGATDAGGTVGGAT
jgi:hypothetical protein